MSILDTTATYKTLQNPIKCIYWRQPSIIREGTLKSKFELLETYAKDDQFWQYLLRCRECNQLYFMEFQEETDWVSGNDPQFTTYVPVSSAEEGDIVQREGCRTVYPSLRIDYPRCASQPAVYWVASEQ